MKIEEGRIQSDFKISTTNDEDFKFDFSPTNADNTVSSNVPSSSFVVNDSSPNENGISLTKNKVFLIYKVIKIKAIVINVYYYDSIETQYVCLVIKNKLYKLT